MLYFDSMASSALLNKYLVILAVEEPLSHLLHYCKSQYIRFGGINLDEFEKSKS